MDFFPSRTLALYMAKMFLIRIFSVAALLVLVLMSLDLLGESGKILANPANGEAELWTYVSLRTPQIVAFALPFSVLLGSLVTLATLNQNSEVVSMKSSGLSAHQILAPLILTSMLVAIVSFLFNEVVVAPSTARLSAWQKVEFGPIPKEGNIRTNVWVKDGNNLINVKTVTGRGAKVLLSDITIFARTENGLQSLLQGKVGQFTGDGWKIDDVTEFDVRTGSEERKASIVLGDTLQPDQFTLADVNAEGLTWLQLRSAITELEKAGRPTMSLEGALWHKIAKPLSAVLMPLLGAVAGFGLARSGQLFVRAVIGMALGFAYFVAENFALAMGNIGAYPPLLAAWAPFVLFFLIGETVLIRTEE